MLDWPARMNTFTVSSASEALGKYQMRETNKSSLVNVPIFKHVILSPVAIEQKKIWCHCLQFSFVVNTSRRNTRVTRVISESTLRLNENRNQSQWLRREPGQCVAQLPYPNLFLYSWLCRKVEISWYVVSALKPGPLSRIVTFIPV